jgi:hypothetical protein
LSVVLWRILVIGDQPVQGDSTINGICTCDVREKFVVEDTTAEVDVAIVIAADMSGSINQIEAALQRESYAAALESATVLKAIKKGVHRKIAVTFVEWSSFGPWKLGWTGPSSLTQRMHPWSLKQSGKSRKGDASVRTVPKHRFHTPSTHLWMPLTSSLSPVHAGSSISRVTDISGDGANNDGSSVEDSRRRALQKAIVINGLPIGSDVENGETITEYYERHVIGGPGSFVIPADSAAEFQWAIMYKLIREVASASGKTHS